MLVIFPVSHSMSVESSLDSIPRKIRRPGPMEEIVWSFTVTVAVETLWIRALMGGRLKVVHIFSSECGWVGFVRLTVGF